MKYAVIRRALLVSALFAGLAGTGIVQAQTTLLNVSYDPTRELYQEFCSGLI